MFRKLRSRMILLNIGVVAMVMITVVFLISYSSSSILRRQADSMKARIEESGFTNWKRPGNFAETPILGNKVITVSVDSDGNLASIADFPRIPDETTRNTLFQLIDENFPDMRYVHSEDRIFFTFNVARNDLKVYFFIDATQERELNTQIIKNTILIGLAAIVLIILASLFLTKRALIPVRQAWKKQKQFVSDASHELRTPVAVIQTNMEVIESDPTASVGDQKSWIENIQFEISRMTKLIDNLLFLSAKDKNSTKSADIICEMGKITEGITENISGSLLGKNLKIVKELTSAPVYVPEIEIERLTVILLENAIKYTNEGIITVKTYKDDIYSVLEVSDTGRGIAELEQKKIFERFYRVDSGRSRKTGGYGLGLSIAKSIAESYNGRIEVQSQSGKGSIFTVYLPSTKK